MSNESDEPSALTPRALLDERRKRGRPKEKHEHPVHKLFEVQRPDGGGLVESICLINNCGVKLPGNHAGNKLSHLKTRHKEVHGNVKAEWDRITASTSGASKKAKKGPTILNGVRMSGSALQLQCLRMVTEDGLSFKSLDSSAFQAIIRPMIQQMPATEKVTISSRTIPPLISSFADRVRAKIAAELEGNMTSVMVDGCSKGSRHFIGVNVQYIKDARIVVRTLAVEELHMSHTGANLKQVISRILRKYSVSMKSVASFTSDNGANYILAGKLLEEEQNEELQDCEEMLWSDLEVELSHGDFRVQIVRCAAHTLQLAVDDALKADGGFSAGTISATRKLAKFMRMPSNAQQLRQNGHPMPLLDVVTRWGSTYDMLVSVAKLRNFMEFSMTVSAKERAENFLTDEQWDNVNALIADLEPVRTATTKLQATNLTLGKFFALWCEAKLIIEKRRETSSLAMNLLLAMEARSKSQAYKSSRRGKERVGAEKLPALFHYPSFNAAVYLDPRYFSLLSEEQTADARKYLLGLSTRLQAIQRVEQLQAEAEEDHSDSSASGSSDSTEEGTFAKVLKRKNKQRLLSRGSAARRKAAPETARAKILRQLEDYDLTAALSESDDLLEFWEGQRLISPELYELAKIVEAIPATQVSVERLFSGLRYILRPQRFNLSAACVDDVVFLHANRDLVQELAIELGETNASDTRVEVEVPSEVALTPNTFRTASSSSTLSDMPSPL